MKAQIAFAAGTPDVNRAMIDELRAMQPELPLLVVSEFEPHAGEWIPYHVQRSFRTNRSAIRAALAGREIALAAVAFSDGTALAKMRAIAFSLSPGSLKFYGRASLPGRSVLRWLRRLAHPSEAEIPVRARLAQLYGLAASRLRPKATTHGTAALNLTAGVTVVIPSRDGRELLQSMLPRVSGATRIIVVDNGSSDGTADWLAQAYPAIHTIVSEVPLSFARAVNAGIAKSQTRHTLLLNNDMLAEPGFIFALEAAFDKIPGLFCATAQIFFPPGIRREETGKAVWRREQPLDFPMRCDEPIPGEDLTPVLYGSGGCSLYCTAKLRQLGGVAEVYEPAYVEDLDLGYRAWKRGWPSVFCAEARAEHRHRATTARFFTKEQLDLFVERNYLRFLIHAVGSPELFRRLWREAIRRLQLLGMQEALRRIPIMGAQPPEADGHLTEPEILALGNGDVACFQGRKPGGADRIVIASPYLPYPLSHGGAVRIFNLMKQAAGAFELVLIAFCDELATPARELLSLCCELILVRRHGSHYRRDSDVPDAVTEFESETFRAALKQTVERWKPAVVQLEFTWMAQYANACGNARTVLVEHDITFDLQQQLMAITTATGAARWELEQQLEKWKRFERNAWGLVDRVVTMSQKDAEVVAVNSAAADRAAVIPNGVDCERFQPGTRRPVHKRLLFIGSFAHLPNVLALQFFLSEVWPRLGPGYALHVIAGQNHERYLDLPAQPGMEIEGFVADVRDAYARAELVLAPLTASAGTNIKVLEAMAMGRVVVTTAAGMNGLDLHPGVDIVLTEGAMKMPGAMAEAIEMLTADHARRSEIEREARRTALRFDWREIGVRQRELYSLLSEARKR